MNKALPRLMSFLMVFVLTAGVYTPGRAISQKALMPAETINIAHFYKPPKGMDAPTTGSHFNTMVLTNGDHAFRDQLDAGGFSSDIPQYFRSEGIQNPGSCTTSPSNNQVGYKTGDFCFISKNHPDWFLLDQYGRRITTSANSSYYRMDPSNAGWRNFFLTRVLESQKQYGWSSLFLDNVEGSLSKFYGDIRPAKYPTDASYQAAIMGFLQYLDVNYSQKYNRPIIGNLTARNDETVWFSYLKYLDGAMQERFAVNWSVDEYISENKWKSDLALMEKTQANGKYLILIAPGSKADSKRQNFAFASYLLISNGKASFRYSTDDSYDDVWLYDNYNLDLGEPLGPRYQSGTSWRRDFTRGCIVVDPAKHSATISSLTKTFADTFIGGAHMSGCSVASGQSQRVQYAGVNKGPVKIVSSANTPISASQRVIFGGRSYSEMMGLPAEQLTNEYWFPYYNNVAMDSQLRVSNLGGSSTTIRVYLGDSQIDSYTLAAGAATRTSYAGQNGGPLKITSSDTNILATVRVLFGGTSYSELMGLPANQLTNEYLFPYYNNVAMDSQLRVSNLGNTTTTIKVYLGNTEIDTYTLAARNATRKNYPGQNGGPLRVTSSSTDILSTVRVLFQGNSYSELMGFPANQLSREYWYPVYDNVALDSQLRVSNVGTGSTTVTVYAGGAKIDGYSLAAGATMRKNYAHNTGPLQVVSSAEPILTTIRMLYKSSLYEMMGLPDTHLSTEYYFPWYNNVAMDSQLRFAIP